jgi:uncharacterized protein YbcI
MTTGRSSATIRRMEPPSPATKAQPHGPPEPVAAGGELNAAIANAVVRIHRWHAGRGPTKARSLFRGNIVVAVLEGVMTSAERSLAAAKKDDEVLSFRDNLQATMSSDLTAAVEELTGCRVTAVLGDSHVDSDMAVQVFVLDRPVDPGRTRSADGRIV